MPPIFVLGAVLLGLACEERPVGRRTDEPGAIVARVNGNPLYQKDFESYLPEDYERVLTSDEQRQYLHRWVTTQLLYDEAIRVGLGLSDEIEARMEQYKKDLVADRLVQEVIRDRAVVSDSEVRAYYEARTDEYTREYRVSHILLDSMEDVEEVKELLKKRTFGWVARRHSLDKHTGIGGDLGYLSKGNMIPEFEEVVFDMKAGEVSDVIESEFGYHLIKLTSVRDARSTNRIDYESAAEDIARELLLTRRAAVYDSLITALFDTARIEVLDAGLRTLAGAQTDTTEQTD